METEAGWISSAQRPQDDRRPSAPARAQARRPARPGGGPKLSLFPLYRARPDGGHAGRQRPPDEGRSADLPRAQPGLRTTASASYRNVGQRMMDLGIEAPRLGGASIAV